MSTPASPGPRPWRTFAWQGIQLETPWDWDLAVVEGNRHKGYCRLDDAEMARLELRWEKASPGRSAADLAQRYLDVVARSSKGRLRVDRRPFSIELADAATEIFSWRGDVDVTGIAVQCSACRRATLMRLFTRPSEESRSLARRVFGSFCDHPRGELVPWSVFDLRFGVPANYDLKGHSFRAGRIELEFQARNILARAARVGLAEILLRERTLADWLRSDPLGEFGRARLQLAERPVRGHAGIELSGTHRGFLRLRQAAIRCRVWHCAESNALLVARWVGPEAELPGFSGFADSFVCHGA